MNKSLITHIQTEKVLYEDIIKEMSNDLKQENQIQSSEVYIHEVFNRERYGKIEIYPKVILPHIQSENILKTNICMIKNNNEEMIWNDKSLKLIILLNLKPNEEKELLKEIQSFMRDLADESFIESLIN